MNKVFYIQGEEDGWLGAEPGWYVGEIEGDSQGPYATREEAEEWAAEAEDPLFVLVETEDQLDSLVAGLKKWCGGLD